MRAPSRGATKTCYLEHFSKPFLPRRTLTIRSKVQTQGHTHSLVIFTTIAIAIAHYLLRYYPHSAAHPTGPDPAQTFLFEIPPLEQ